MNEQINNRTLFTEIFPVKQDTLPTLHSYQLEIKGGDFATIGGKLAYRLGRSFEGHWAWAGNLIITDIPRNPTDVMSIVETLWVEQPEIFRSLHRVSAQHDWTPSALAVAEFVARGLLRDVSSTIENALAEKKQELGNKAQVERIYDMRGWVVDGKPAVSVSISSRLVLKETLRSYATRVGVSNLIGLQVADITSTLKGEIIEIIGHLEEHRRRLLSITQREEMQKLLTSAPDNEIVATVSTGRNNYDYWIGALRIILLLEYVHRFGINSRQALSALRIEPKLRAEIVTKVAEIITKTGYLERAYNSITAPLLFNTTPFTASIRFRNGRATLYDEKTILKSLKENGVYKISDKYSGGKPIRVGFLTALEETTCRTFWQDTEERLRPLGFSVQKIGDITVKDASRAELDKAISQFEAQAPDILVAFFPDDFSDEDDDETAYNHFKSLTIGRGIPSQVIEASTLENEKIRIASIGNIVLGIIGKTGNIPYVLAEPLPFADVIVGIDIAREKKKHLPGTRNATALTRVYLNNGEFLQYAIHDASLEGETIPPSVLQALFPIKEFGGKRVVVHRDGYFRGNEKQVLTTWAKKIGASFHLVEVIKSGAPRLYAVGPKQGQGETRESSIVQPQKGSAFIISSSEAILVSSLPPFANATPRPLRIRSEPPFSIELAIQSVLAMTNLHYGSVRSPRLPVTIHFSDKIAGLALKGIKPKNLEGDIPFWL